MFYLIKVQIFGIKHGEFPAHRSMMFRYTLHIPHVFIQFVLINDAYRDVVQYPFDSQYAHVLVLLTLSQSETCLTVSKWNTYRIWSTYWLIIKISDFKDITVGLHLIAAYVVFCKSNALAWIKQTNKILTDSDSKSWNRNSSLVSKRTKNTLLESDRRATATKKRCDRSGGWVRSRSDTYWDSDSC